MYCPNCSSNDNINTRPFTFEKGNGGSVHTVLCCKQCKKCVIWSYLALIRYKKMNLIMVIIQILMKNLRNL